MYSTVCRDGAVLSSLLLLLLTLVTRFSFFFCICLFVERLSIAYSNISIDLYHNCLMPVYFFNTSRLILPTYSIDFRLSLSVLLLYFFISFVLFVLFLNLCFPYQHIYHFNKNTDNLQPAVNTRTTVPIRNLAVYIHSLLFSQPACLRHNLL